MAVFFGTECPKCKKKTVFPYSKIIEIDGEPCGPMTCKCSSCGWEPSDKVVIKSWKEQRGEELSD